MKKQALLIGINEYQILPGLKYARQDAEAVADSLKQNYNFSDNEIIPYSRSHANRFMKKQGKMPAAPAGGRFLT